MKFILVLATLVVATAASPTTNTLSSDFIDFINTQQSSWTAGSNFLANSTLQQLSQLAGTLGVHPDPNYKPEVKLHQVNFEDIPDTFDARKKWSNCPSLNRIRDQGACGSCWAFSSVEIMSDRVCIHSSGSLQFWFSPEDLISCCSTCGTCRGGYLMPSFDYYISEGVVSGGDLNSSEGCKPYTADAYDDNKTPSCVQSCRSGYSITYDADKHYGSSGYSIDNTTEQIQTEIMSNGPIVVTFKVYLDFYTYTSGVYNHVTGGLLGAHTVKMIGWGTENGTPYWLMANSWGNEWGLDGFFKIRKGTNECSIEDSPLAVLPRL